MVQFGGLTFAADESACATVASSGTVTIRTDSELAFLSISGCELQQADGAPVRHRLGIEGRLGAHHRRYQPRRDPVAPGGGEDQQADQQDRAAAEPIRQRPEDRRCHRVAEQVQRIGVVRYIPGCGVTIVQGRGITVFGRETIINGDDDGSACRGKTSAQ